MANEFEHKSVGTSLTQAEYESAGDSHQFDSQATGDIMYASSSTNLRSLAIGSANDVLVVSSGKPAWTDPDTMLGNATAAGLAQVIVKASDESVTSSTTLQNDDDFTFTATANGIYLMELLLYVVTATTPDFKFGWSVPGSGTVDGLVVQQNSATAVQPTTEAAATSPLISSGTDMYLLISAVYQADGTTFGAVNFQWAQNTSDGTAATVKTGSLMRYRKVG